MKAEIPQSEILQDQIQQLENFAIFTSIHGEPEIGNFINSWLPIFLNSNGTGRLLGQEEVNFLSISLIPFISIWL